MFTGYRILDLTDERGQLCARMLADMGADVIKIEPPSGDSARRLGPFVDDVPDPERSLTWFSYNFNKRGVTLNLDTADGRDLFKRLVPKADAVVESFAPGYLPKLGLGYDDLSRLNPRLVMLSITPFGQSGPDAHAETCDLTLVARAGLLNICGEAGRPPARVRIPQSHAQAGAQGGMALAMALRARDEMGVGQYIDLSMQEAIAGSLITVQQNWDILRRNEARGTKMRRGNVMGAFSWPCKDGHIAWCWWVAPGWGYKMYGLMEWMTEEAMAGDLWDWDWENRSTNELSQQEVDHWEELFGKFFMAHTKKDIYDEALKRRIMLFPTYNALDLVEYEHLRARGYFQKVQHPELGREIEYPGFYAMTSEGMWSLRLRPPAVGEHNREVYGSELGLSPQDLSVLKAAGAI